MAKEGCELGAVKENWKRERERDERRRLREGDRGGCSNLVSRDTAVHNVSAYLRG